MEEEGGFAGDGATVMREYALISVTGWKQRQESEANVF